MIETTTAYRGIVTAPHHLAAQAGLSVLREGGNAIEAMIAAAATISVVYPHMNGLGGDGFWLISEPGARVPRAIRAVGAAGAAVDEALYRDQGLATIPTRGPLAANTIAGTVAGWQAALTLSDAWGGKLPLARLLEEALYHAQKGFPVTEGQCRNSLAKRAELDGIPGWAELFLPDGEAPAPGRQFKQPALAATLERLATAGLDDFYRGALAKRIAADLARAGSPITADDLAGHQAIVGNPLSVTLRCGTVYNLAPPSQGLASLVILALFDRLDCREAESFAHLHGLVEATKQAILLRNAKVTDPAFMSVAPESLLSEEALDPLVRAIDLETAAPWPVEPVAGDTVWLGAIDGEGRAVSFIHSIYWEFGSGVCLRDTGIVWQNRGSSFSLRDDEQNYIRPGRLPFHTNNPAMAILNDGRVMAYGAMGGEGQPQTQSAIFTRYAQFGAGLQRAITAPRWVLGRTWGDPKTNLRLEARFPPALIEALRAAGHEVEIVGDFDDVMGHGGAVVWHKSGLIEGASDPRCDGAAAAF